MPADAPALRLLDPLDAGGVVSAGLLLLLLLLLLPLAPVVLGALVVLLDDDDDDDDDDDAFVVDETDETVEEVDGSRPSPNTCRPELRSSPMRLNVALFSASMPSTPVRTLNQHGVPDVKLSTTGTFAVKPGAFCW